MIGKQIVTNIFSNQFKTSFTHESLFLTLRLQARSNEERRRAPSCLCSGNMLRLIVRNSSLVSYSAFLFILNDFKHFELDRKFTELTPATETMMIPLKQFKHRSFVQHRTPKYGSNLINRYHKFVEVANFECAKSMLFRVFPLLAKTISAS